MIYDPKLTMGLPVGMSVVSGLNAIAHAAEGLYASDASPITSLMAEEGIRALADGLPLIHRRVDDPEGRSVALYGAWLCGSVLGSVGMSLHHKLCHTLGGSFGLPHAETHAVVLAHALAYNRRHAIPAMQRIARALRADDAPVAIRQIARSLGAPIGLREIGMAEADLDHAAELALANAYWNPRPLDRRLIRQLLQRAWEGAAPESV